MIPSQVSGHPSRFGFDMDSEGNKYLLDKLGQLHALVQVSSLHFHLGGPPASPEQFEKLAEFASRVWQEFYAQGFEVGALNLGGGFPGSLSHDGLSKFSQAVQEALKRGQVPDSVKILFEPGRAIVENAGALCVKVVDISTRHGEVFALVDGGSNLVMPAWMLKERKRKIRKLNSGRNSSPKYTGRITVVGPLCAENDTIGQIAEISEVSVGDVLIIEDCGAYDWSTRYHFNGKMPPAYLADEAGRSKIMR
jgi:diaminopimelate decarboxylase